MRLRWLAVPSICSLLLLLLLSATPLASANDADALLRDRVLKSIQRAQQFLLSQQLRDGSWQPSLVPKWKIGVTSLALLSLLNSGMPPDEPSVARGLAYLRGAQDPDQTYELAMMIMALAAANDNRDLGRIGRLTDWLSSYQHKGGGEPAGSWGYGAGGGWWDNSNTQFALLGLREAAMLGIPVDQDVWRRSQDHWLKLQEQAGRPRNQRGNDSGHGWNYAQGNVAASSGSMTVAGIASLTITSAFLRDTRDEIKNGRLDCCGADAADEDAQLAIDAGVRWLGHHFSVRSNPGAGGWLLYYLYGLERAGRMTGSRFFGEHDWYREGARRLVDNQDVRGGSWISEGEPDPVVGTSLGLLFLSKGPAPVLVNKLKFGPRDPRSGDLLTRDWNRHPRDVGNLTEYVMTRDKWPKLVTWQVVDLDIAQRNEGVAALLQAPVQLMSGSDSPGNLPEEQVELLREYILQGGFLFAVQNCDSAAFDAGFRRLVERMFPEGEFQLKELPDTHDIYRSEFLLAEAPPQLYGVDLGCRTAIVYAPHDHACRWDRWMRFDPRGRAPEVKGQINKSLQLGVNVLAYATGRELLDKLRTPEVVKLQEDDPLNRGRLTVARIRHTGGWDTAPNALKHLKLALLDVGIEMSALAPSIPATDPSLFDYPIVYVHGRKNFSLTEAERDKLRAYLRNGGFLFADACCGARQFDASFRKLVEQLFERPLERIPATHELFHNAVAHDIRQVKRRIPADNTPAAVLTAAESVGEPLLEGLEIDGRYAVVYSKYDLSCALERQARLACAGYPTDDAAKIAVNIVLYALYR